MFSRISCVSYLVVLISILLTVYSRRQSSLFIDYTLYNCRQICPDSLIKQNTVHHCVAGTDIVPMLLKFSEATVQFSTYFSYMNCIYYDQAVGLSVTGPCNGNLDFICEKADHGPIWGLNEPYTGEFYYSNITKPLAPAALVTELLGQIQYWVDHKFIKIDRGTIRDLDGSGPAILTDTISWLTHAPVYTNAFKYKNYYTVPPSDHVESAQVDTYVSNCDTFPLGESETYSNCGLTSYHVTIEETKTEFEEESLTTGTEITTASENTHSWSVGVKVAYEKEFGVKGATSKLSGEVSTEGGGSYTNSNSRTQTKDVSNVKSTTTEKKVIHQLDIGPNTKTVFGQVSHKCDHMGFARGCLDSNCVSWFKLGYKKTEESKGLERLEYHTTC